ncbi:MAG: archaeosortase/exosortase family protein [Planctomycetaceae bacterium]|jgi:exosortase|nr:archaeosortase/exosortase family protein [Planctomycetaceae bacterium]
MSDQPTAPQQEPNFRGNAPKKGRFADYDPASPLQTMGQRGAVNYGKPETVPQTGYAPAKVAVSAVRLPVDVPFERLRLLLILAVLAPLCVWASYSSWANMVYEWYHTDDYSHGFLVIPAVVFFLYIRLDTYPGTCSKLAWLGLFPVLIYTALRVYAGIHYMESVDSYAIFFWILSVVWFFYGLRVFLWALPSLIFLIFMFQLPWSVDAIMRNHLQTFAAKFAAFLLQLAGEPAIAIKNTIRLGAVELGVAQACSGLRFLMSVFAIAFAAALILRRPWWQNIFILAVAAPLALFVNAVRIAITGMLILHCEGMLTPWVNETESLGKVADGIAGKIAIVIALGLFALFVWYLSKVFRRVTI